MKMKNNKNHKPLGIICTRVSTKSQTNEMRHRKFKAFIIRSDWKLYKEFTDKGYSGVKKMSQNSLIESTQRSTFTKYRQVANPVFEVAFGFIFHGKLFDIEQR
jgi:hypothetical protein